jgi:excisionase family DNA binding protein
MKAKTKPKPAPKGNALERLRSQLAHGVPDVADFLGVSASAIRSLISSGRLHAIRVGGGEERVHLLVSTQEIERLLAGSAATAEAKS